MSLIIQKFGGSSLATALRLQAAAERIEDALREGNQVVAVVSAQGKTTDALCAKAMELTASPDGREMDQLLSCGEQASAALCAIALQQRGIPAISLTGWQAGVFTDAKHQNAWPQSLICSRIRRELAAGKVVVVTGFQGLDANGDITTLGRGGSDTTAVALCAFLGAARCCIYTDVDGVYTADPRKDPKAQKLAAVSYAKMLSMAREGAKVLHDRCVELAQRYGIELEVLSSFEKKPGTRVNQTGV